MARLADTDIEKLKTEVSLLRLIESQGCQPRKQGKDYVIACPFHGDDTPSLNHYTPKEPVPLLWL